MSDVQHLLVDVFNVPIMDIEKACSYQKKFGGRLEQILVSMGSLSSDILPDFYAQLLQLPILTEQDIIDWKPPSGVEDLPLTRLLQLGWLPYRRNEAEGWIFATTSPFQTEAAELLNGLGHDVELVIVQQDLFAMLQATVEGESTSAPPGELSSIEEARLRELATEAPTVNLLNALITRALRQRASDMHIEPFLNRGKVRFRIDGVLQDIEAISGSMLLPIITRLKILSNMDIAEKRRPQDGKIEMKIGGVELDIRVSALPLNDGESVVMRFLRKDTITYDMDILGIAADIKSQILQDIKKTAGVVLLTGPTGSGKTTSLYTFLNHLNTPGVKIITLEDPVEYQLDGVNQVQVQPDIGFDFSAGLRSIVRQDPDVIMVGEIRDKETAAIAMQSALTGHLVFSTVHTNDAPSAYTRLLDLGVEEFLLNAALVSIAAQRLVRKLCPHCSQPHENHVELIEAYQLEQLATEFGITDLNLRQASGCEHCSHTGYQGRLAIIEYLRCSDAIKAIPKDKDFIQKAKAQNLQQGGRTLFMDGMLKALQGATTIDEVLRVAG